ncbi:hypothetical protein BCV69DRAFT_280354 [Microstroma glucosiphilum]|uniref:Uncharacterized protein n=1 Tax=Pseudomicrostroma glucosiphilum TaxID=1684307 RepID=A0A316UCY9_9BASI|nr:hypothetical protein BCV69DRAFT_280354 [Pseudomicrostroma glucosiphilum]PWN22748.1 hypothetical protein BCV69DRAFT_280354 [Pseudomicrostroma glucosiphilum]
MNSQPSFDEALGHKPTVAQRESRIGSIYEKYLYDPKDLTSADPLLRALARNASGDNVEGSYAGAGGHTSQPFGASAGGGFYDEERKGQVNAGLQTLDLSGNLMDVLLETEETADGAQGFSAVPTPFKERSASHKALTAQLGLDTPLPPPQEWRDSSYFASRPAVPFKRTSASSSQASMSPTKSSFRTPQRPPSAILPSPNPSVPSSGSSQHSAFRFGSDVDSLASPPLSPSDSFRKSSPRAPKPLLLCQGLEPVSPPKSMGNPPPLGFSETGDAAVVKQKYSLLRRSVAFVTGSNGPSRKPSVLNGRQSLMQKSLTLVMGGQRPSEASEKLFDDEETLAPPRHRGFEKADTKSPQIHQLASPRGDTAEWDADGAAAQFWRRFELAQKRAELDEKSSQTLRQRLDAQRKAHLWSVGSAAILIVAAIIAVIVWRANLNDANTQPSAANRGSFAGTTTPARRALRPTGTQARRALKATSTLMPASQLKRRLIIRDQLWVDAQVKSPTKASGSAATAAQQHPAVDVISVRSPAEIGAYDHQNPGLHRRLTKRHSQMRRRLSE